ncbi:hypothetical protein H2198_000836 [Neophaeococcomyces mojaviensis]|uniref:Uncharacterized protein n=1 Tax=Neophaeococcomyces mojaviensis TaxID=3383035 RepID=A0ACC3AIG2_9EURO|nr:hypothetical protein H2198_000836 [Knufia sp. JES_112]
MFQLVESRDGPGEHQPCRTVLTENESFETDFIGASEQDCREWALQRQFQNKTFEQDLIAIVDQQSALDETISLQCYKREPGIELPKHGVLPRKLNQWYTFRVVYTEVNQAYTHLESVVPEIVYPVYFGRKDELTNERGVFDIAKALELCLRGPDAPGES